MQLTALPGEIALPGESGDGTAGYSGGGGYGPTFGGGHGGSDGGDGQDGDELLQYIGGQGSGLDVRTIPLTHFELR